MVQQLPFLYLTIFRSSLQLHEDEPNISKIPSIPGNFRYPFHALPFHKLQQVTHNLSSLLSFRLRIVINESLFTSHVHSFFLQKSLFIFFNHFSSSFSSSQSIDEEPNEHFFRSLSTSIPQNLNTGGREPDFSGAISIPALDIFSIHLVNFDMLCLKKQIPSSAYITRLSGLPQYSKAQVLSSGDSESPCGTPVLTNVFLLPAFGCNSDSGKSLSYLYSINLITLLISLASLLSISSSFLNIMNGSTVLKKDFRSNSYPLYPCFSNLIACRIALQAPLFFIYPCCSTLRPFSVTAYTMSVSAFEIIRDSQLGAPIGRIFPFFFNMQNLLINNFMSHDLILLIAPNSISSTRAVGHFQYQPLATLLNNKI